MSRLIGVRLRTPDSLGCSVAGSAVIHSLRASFPEANINVVSKFPELFQGIKGITIEAALAASSESYDVDLRRYTARRPHNTAPYRPSYLHMIEMAEEQLSARLIRSRPHLELSSEEVRWANQTLRCFERPVVWLQTRTTSANRDWPTDRWNALAERLRGRFHVIDLSAALYSYRQSLALTRASVAGICLDSFLLHGSWAVGARNVLVLLGSSRPECVTYPGQKVLYGRSSCAVQPCGMHGYAVGCCTRYEAAFAAAGYRGCIFQRNECMEAISVNAVAAEFTNMVRSRRAPSVSKIVPAIFKGSATTQNNAGQRLADSRPRSASHR